MDIVKILGLVCAGQTVVIIAFCMKLRGLLKRHRNCRDTLNRVANERDELRWNARASA